MDRLYEEVYNDLVARQSNISKLFPNFRDRVKAVAARGGVKMVEMLPDTWHFKVNSGTKEGVRYDVYMKFKNMTEVLTKWIFNETMWDKTKEHVDYRKLAAEVINEVDLELSCSDPSFLYYGGAYILTQRGAKYGDKENRPPVVRNPKQRGSWVCKHISLVAEVLPFYVSTFSSFLKKYWKSEIEQIEGLYKQEILAGEEESEDQPSTIETPSETPQISPETPQEQEIPSKTGKSTLKQKTPLKTQATMKIDKATKPATSPASDKYKGEYNVG